MKVAIGIIIAALVAAVAAVFVLFVFRSHDLVLCGDIPQKSGDQLFTTRVYTYDVDANSTLTQIIDKMNSNTEGTLSAEEMTEILSQYQTIVYAPVFTYMLTQEDNNTYVLTGSVYNGWDADGEPADTEYVYKDLTLTVGVTDGRVLAAQNIYPEDLEEELIPEFKERKKVVDPVLVNEKEAAFAFSGCNSFRLVFTGKESIPAEVTLVYRFDVGSQNILNFSGSKDNILAVTIRGEYDDMGRLSPTIEMNRRVVEVEIEE
ncbi:MAG: hypothetical protein K2J80_11920 [Oscillospiraceae bacterium]|nr:hypothetical protein [Oscillospiraceae bacterium]